MSALRPSLFSPARVAVLLLCAALLCVSAAAAQAAPFAYIPNAGDNTVSVIDTATNTVTATVPVGSPSVLDDGARRAAGRRGGEACGLRAGGPLE